MQLFLRRARLFRNALIALYLSFAVLALGTLLGLLLQPTGWGELAMKLCVTLGVAVLLFAAGQLMIESRLALRTMQQRCYQPPPRPKGPKQL
jgi:hypothetical protein